MMNCCESLDDFFDGDLSPDETDELMLAVSHCAACQERLRSEDLLTENLREAWALIGVPSNASSSTEQRKSTCEPPFERTESRRSSSPIHAKQSRNHVRWFAAISMTVAVVLTTGLIVLQRLASPPAKLAAEQGMVQEVYEKGIDDANVKSASRFRVDDQHIGITTVDDDEFAFVIVYPVE